MGWGVRHFPIIGSWGYATGWHFHARIDYNKVAFPIFEILVVRKFWYIGILVMGRFAVKKMLLY